MRVFFNHHPIQTYKAFKAWTKDSNEHVRRWVSEGSRPNLPWGKKISNLDIKKNIQLLEHLKDDPSEYVRKSVANHMNDISWIDADLTLKTLKKWQKLKNKERQWIIKHALRSLLKQGHPEALEILDFSSKTKTKIESLKLSKKKINEGESFDLSFEVQNLEKKDVNLMIDYIVFYPKANGQLSPKVFKLKSLTLPARKKTQITKKIHFKKVTVRKHYKGEHKVQIQINGLRKDTTTFLLSLIHI